MSSQTPIAGDQPQSERLMYALFEVSVLARLGLSGLILNKYINYTSLEGSIVEKIHPAFYAIFFSVVAFVLTRKIALSRQDLQILRAIVVFMMAIAAVLTIPMLEGRSASSAGYLVDSYVVACLAAIVLMAVPDAWRTQLARLIFILLILNALAGIGEFALKVRLLPYADGEDTFRPTGLTDHPLDFGIWCALGVAFAGVTRWRPAAHVLAVGVLLAGAAVSGARVATIVAIANALAALLLTPVADGSSAALQRRLVVAVGAALIMGAAAVGLLAAGALNRFQGGLVDDSSLARVGIYNVFQIFSWREMLLGTDYAPVQRYAAEVLDLPFIESSIVAAIILSGLIGLTILGAALANLFIALLRGRSWLVTFATLTFLALSATSNALTTKSSNIMLIVILIMCDRTTRRAPVA